MPLAERLKGSNLKKFQRGFSTFTGKAGKFMANNLLEVIFILFLIISIFGNLGILLGIFIVFYFADRWEIKKLFIKEDRITVEHKEIKTIDSEE